MKKNRILISIIFLIALILRMWDLGVTPPSPTWDEASLGYNAYSLLKTGKDEYGTTLPLTLRSFDDYKPGLYAYLIIPFLLLFDVSLVAVRFPSILLGIGTVVVVYFLIRELFKNNVLALLSAFLLAISPWHIQFSRAGFEANVGLSFAVFTTFLFLKGLRSPWLMSLAAMFAALNLSVYQSERVFMPLLVFLLILLYRKEVRKLPKKYLLSALIVGLLFSLPFITGILSGQALKRAQGTTVFSRESTEVRKYQQRFAKSVAEYDVMGQLISNRRVVYTKQALQGYLSHYNLTWLFITGDNPRHHAPAMGLLYLWELPFLLIGLYAVVFYKKQSQHFTRAKVLVLGWLLLAPVPASITIDVPHALRSLHMLPMLQVLVAFGVFTVSTQLITSKNIILQKTRYLLLGIALLLFLFNGVYYLNQYFVQYNYASSQDFQYGYEQTVTFVKDNAHKYDRIIVANDGTLDQSYIFFLFYLRYPPSLYQQQIKENANKSRDFDKFEFRGIQWDKEEFRGNTLYVGKPKDFPETIPTVATIRYLNGDPAITLVEVK